MAHCGSCGTANHGQTFCEMCGTRMVVEAPPPPELDKPQTTRPQHRWKYMMAAWALLVVGLLGLGFLTGYFVHGKSTPAPPTEATATDFTPPSIEPAKPATVETQPMPDVRGLTEKDALQAIADAGLTPTEVVVQQRETVASEGYIVAQEPLAGTDNPKKVILYLPVPAKVPNLTGASEANGRKALEKLGSYVSIQRQYRAGTNQGTVIGTAPKAGEQLTAESTLIVAAEPARKPLSVATREGGCSNGKTAVNGASYENSVLCRAQENPKEVFWLLNRKVAAIDGVIGVVDTDKPGMSAKVTLVADGKVVYEGTTTYGTAEKIKIDVTGALRLSVFVQAPRTDADMPTVALGNFELLGSSEDLKDVR